MTDTTANGLPTIQSEREVEELSAAQGLRAAGRSPRGCLAPPPRVLTVDVEIMTPVEENPNGWDGARRGECGISSAVVFDTASGRYHLYDAHSVDRLCDHLEAGDLLVSFNGKGFDLPCIEGVAARWLTVAQHFDILEAIWQALGSRQKGYGLDPVCERTLGLRKSGSGARAPELARQARWADLFDYNLNDVWMTRELYNHVLKCGTIVDVNGDELALDIPLGMTPA
jgi:hypothetical protein